MIRPNLFYFLSVPFFHSFSLLIRAGNLANTSGAEQHHHAMSRHATPTATPSPRSEQPHTHEQPHPNGIRAHNLNRFREADGRTLVPVWNASRPKPCAHGASRTPRARLGGRQNIPTSFALPSPYQRVAVRRVPFLG